MAGKSIPLICARSTTILPTMWRGRRGRGRATVYQSPLDRSTNICQDPVSRAGAKDVNKGSNMATVVGRCDWEWDLGPSKNVQISSLSLSHRAIIVRSRDVNIMKVSGWSLASGFSQNYMGVSLVASSVTVPRPRLF